MAAVQAARHTDRMVPQGRWDPLCPRHGVRPRLQPQEISTSSVLERGNVVRHVLKVDPVAGVIVVERDSDVVEDPLERSTQSETVTLHREITESTLSEALPVLELGIVRGGQCIGFASQPVGLRCGFGMLSSQFVVLLSPHGVRHLAILELGLDRCATIRCAGCCCGCLLSQFACFGECTFALCVVFVATGVRVENVREEVVAQSTINERAWDRPHLAPVLQLVSASATVRLTSCLRSHAASAVHAAEEPARKQRVRRPASATPALALLTLAASVCLRPCLARHDGCMRSGSNVVMEA